MDKRPSIDDIIRAGCDVYGVDIDYVHQKSRKGEVIWLRQTLQYMARKLTRHTQREVGERIGGKNHATVLHSERVVEHEMDKYLDRKAFVREIEGALRDKGFSTEHIIRI